MKLQIGVKVLLKNLHTGKYLFIRRTKLLQNETERQWDIPGGRIESEESLLDALRREVLEETGIVLDDTPKLINSQDIFVPAKDLHVVRLTYIVTTKNATVTLSDEHDLYEWFFLDQVEELQLEPFLHETIDQLNAETF